MQNEPNTRPSPDPQLVEEVLAALSSLRTEIEGVEAEIKKLRPEHREEPA
jgi:hypothetical protein